MSKRGQITIFIILGVIIVIAMGLLFAVNIEDEFSVPGIDTTVKEYVSNCLERIADEGLYLIGKQGGVLYDTQIKKGSILSYPRFDYGEFVLEYDSNDVAYGIKRGVGNGINTLKPLCNKEGKNKWDLSTLKYSCETYDVFNLGQNIQDYLQEYINESIIKKDKCDIESLEEKYGYKINKRSVKTEILIGNDDLNIDLEYGLTIKINDKSETELLKFNYNPQIRLKKIHELASHLIGFDSLKEVNPLVGDIYDIEFDIINHARSNTLRCKSSFGSCLLDGMEVTKIKDVYEHDDVLKIIDKKSMIYGKPYVFLFAIENRVPYLEPIGDEIISDGDELKLELKAHDPDEDILGYSFSGCDNQLKDREFQGIKFVAEGENTGTCQLTLKVCDESNYCNSKTVEIKVQ